MQIRYGRHKVQNHKYCPAPAVQGGYGGGGNIETFVPPRAHRGSLSFPIGNLDRQKKTRKKSNVSIFLEFKHFLMTISEYASNCFTEFFKQR